MLFEDDPDEMTPEARLAEIATILAAGFLRLRKRGVEHAADPSPSTENPLDCSGPPMAVCDNRLTQRDPAEDAA
jgi:hypothetical protein